MEMVNVLFQIQHLQNLYIYFIYLQLQWEFNNSRKKYFSLWNTRLIVLFAWESTQAQSKGKKSEPVPGFLHQLWEAADKHGPATMLLCDWVSPNSIKTKYPWGLSLLLQDWRWRLKQSFNLTHLKQAKWVEPYSSSLFAQVSLPAPEEPCWTPQLCCLLTWVNEGVCRFLQFGADK